MGYQMKLYEVKVGDIFKLQVDEQEFRLINIQYEDKKGYCLCLNMKDFYAKYYPDDLLVDLCEDNEINSIREELIGLKRLNREITETWIMDY